jgi:tripartite-type tricarboxylate transporter receptor subunit TctC
MRFAIALLSGLLALGALFAAPASAQSYPARPVRVIVPFPAGGFTDVGARIVAQKLAEVVGQPMVIENRAGASGTLGVGEAVKSAPDGYTLLMTTGDFATVTALMPKMAFDPLTALIPVTRFVTVPLLLLTNPNSGVGSVKELIEKAKAAPGKYAYASPGPGTINQLAAEWFALEAGIKLLHVPYKGGAQMATGLAGGEIPLAVTTQGTVQGLLEAGKIKPLSVLGRTRPSFLREMPSMADSNLNVDAELNISLYVPAGTPAEIVSRLDAAVLQVLRDEAIRKRFTELGMDVTPVSGAALAERLRSDAARFQRVIEQTGVKLN